MNVCSVVSDVGADILDLAETMITSNGLTYEPVCGVYISHKTQTSFLSYQ